jgi:hypothetical protein
MPRVTRKDRDWAEMMAHDLAEDALEITDAPVPLVEGRIDPVARRDAMLAGRDVPSGSRLNSIRRCTETR